MGRQSCSVKPKLRKGLWSPEEDEKLFNYITRFGIGCWSSVPKLAGLQRCGKSCRLRWINYLRPDLKRGMFSQQEEDLILSLHEALGNRWAQIAAQLPGRTDNEIKNFWNSYLKKKLVKKGIDPNTHKPISDSEERVGNKYREKSPMGLPQLRGFPTVSVSAAMDQTLDVNGTSYCEIGLEDASSDQFEIKSVFDPLLLYEFQGSVEPIGYNSCLLPQYQQNLRHYNHQNRLEVNPEFGFTSMPSLLSFDHGNMGKTDFSGNSTSRMSPSNSSNVNSHSGFQMNSVPENAAFSWGTDKLESSFQCQVIDGIKSEELKASPWPEEQLHPHNPEDYGNCPLTTLSEDLTGADMDVFLQI
ncbi:hypothetical protein U1Q18_007240 [Sarracenia purpurea var. burkii]